MSKISTYEVAPVPKLSDKLIGTSVGGEIEDITYNFTLLELLELFLPVIPANNLQGVLDYGNTATQDINLFGTITTTNLEVTDTANLFITYLNEETHIVGSLFDSADSVGTAGQVLTSTGEGVEWFTLPPIFTPNLQQVLEEGNTADLDIILDADLEAINITADTANIATQLSIQGTVVDYNESAGTSGQVLESTSTGVQWVNLPVYSATSPLLFDSGTNTFSIQVANSTQGGYLTANDWVTFDGKQNAGAYITALTGEATATGPGSVPITLNNASVIAKVLTGLNITGGSISATDSILTAFGKVQNQINGLMGGVQYQGVWDAATNTPTLTSSVGTQGHYYIVNVAGTTNLNGITDWQVGDWAIFSGGAWQKVDNTDSVTSVNGQTGAVSLTTDNIPEGTTNLYFLDSRARAAVSATSPLSYNNTTGVFSIQQASGTQNGYLSSTDWTTFNNKQNYLSGTGLVKSTAGTITYITDNSSNWNTAYNRSIISAAVTGTGTKTLTLNEQDGNTITASWSDADTGLTSVGLTMPSAFSVANSPLTSNGTIGVTGAGTTAEYIRGDGSLATFPSIISEAQNLVTEVYNSSGATLTKGTVVYINGGQGNLPTITKAIATGDPTSAQTYGVVRSDITNMNNGYVVVTGRLGDLDTRDYTPGQQLYLSSTTAGAWTPTKQYAPAHLVYVGIVVRAHPTQGVVEILIQNGFEMDELHNVAAQNPDNNDILQFKTSTNLWTKVAGTTTNIAEGTNLYYLDSRARAALSFTPGSGAYNSTTGVITIPTNTNQLTNGAAFITLGSLSASAPLSYNNTTGAFSISQSGSSTDGYLSSTDWNTFNNKQPAGSYVPTSRLLSINGTQYDLSADRSWSVGTVTSVAALTLGTSGTDLSSTVATATTTPVITLNVPTASAANRGALSAADWSTFNTKVGGVTASSPLASSGGQTPNITIQQASGSQDGYLSSTDWTTFNNKQAAGNYITSLTGEATASGPGAASVTLNNASVTAKVLTGVNITGGSISATDSILTAFGKVQNQINGLVGGSIYQGTWNAATNTPALASGVGTKGYYYIVSVAGTTNLDGITDWFVGDWAIFDGTAWQQVDNTDAVVSVNGQTGAVSLTTDNIPEGATNQYFLNSRARAALSFTAGSGAYNSTTGVITIPTNTSQLTNGANFITLASLSGTAPIQYNNTTGAISITQAGTASNGYLSSTDWNTFNNKQATISLTTTGTSGAATLVGTTLNIPQYQSVLTNPVTGTGNNNYIAKFTSTGSTIGNSLLQSTASNVFINQEDTSFGIDAQANTRLGFTKKGGSQPVLSYATDPFVIASSSGTDIAALNTFTPRLELSIAGVLSVFNYFQVIDASISGSGVYINQTGRVGGRQWSVLNGNTAAGEFSIKDESAALTRFKIATDGTTTIQQKIVGNGILQINGATDPNDTSAAYFWNASGIGPTISGLKFQVRVGSTQATKLFVTDLGYLGVNTTTPQSNFVVSNDAGTQSIELNQLTSVSRIFAYNRSTSTAIPLSLNDTGGNVLVGTTVNSGYTFDVNGTGRFTNKLTLDGNIENTNNSNLVITSNGGILIGLDNNAEQSDRVFMVYKQANTALALFRVEQSGDIYNYGLVYVDKTLGASQPNIRLRTATDSYVTQWGIGQIASSTNFGLAYFNGSSWISPYITVTTAGAVILTSSITASSIIKSGGTSAQYLMADGSVSTGPSLTGYVPYTGATTNVNLGSNSLQVNQKIGTTDNQGIFLRGITDATHKLYYSTTRPGIILEINNDFTIDYYNTGSPATRFTFGTGGNFTSVGNVVADSVALMGQVPTYGTPNAQFSHKDRAGAGEYSFLSASTGETFINSKTGTHIYFRVNNGNIGTFFSTGNLLVGTGTTDAGYKLDVSGTGRFTGQLTSGTQFYVVASPPATNGGLINVRDTVTATNVTSFAGVFFNSSPGNDYSIGKLTENNVGFLQIRNANSGAELLRINASGITTLSNLAGTGTRIVVADASGVLSASSALSGYVPYTGATANVNLGAYSLTANNFTGAYFDYKPGGTETFFIGKTSYNVFDGNQLGIATFTALPIEFATNNVKRLTIASTGVSTFSNVVISKVYFNANDNTRDLYLNPAADFGSGVLPAVQVATNHALQFATNNTRRGAFKANGDFEIGYVNAANDAMIFNWAGASSTGSIQTYSSSNLALQPYGNNLLIGTLVNNGHKVRIVGDTFTSGYINIDGEGKGVTVDAGGSAATARVGLMKYGGFEGMLVSGIGTVIRLAHRLDSEYVLTGGTPSIRVDLLIATNGAATFSSSVTATAFYESSDSRLKQLIQDDYKAVGIETIKPKLYIKDGREEVGYFAQDVQNILSTAVSINDAGFLSLSYTQVHTAKIAIIEDEVAVLKKEVAELKVKLQKYEA